MAPKDPEHPEMTFAARAVAPTSWTRTIRAPRIMAQHAVVSEPTNRSSTATGSGPSKAAVAAGRTGVGRKPAVRAGQQHTEGPLAAGADRDREPLRHQVVQTGQERHVVGGRLAEPDARVQPHLRDPGPGGPVGPLDQEPGHVVDHVVVAGLALHGPRVAHHVHGHPPDAQVGGHRPQRRAHVVDEGGARRHGGPGRGPVAGVDRQADPGPRAVLRHRLQDRQHPGLLADRVHRLRAGPGGLAADVDHRRPLRHHRRHPGPGPLGVLVQAAVGEGVRRDVEDAHHQCRCCGWRPDGGHGRLLVPPGISGAGPSR